MNKLIAMVLTASLMFGTVHIPAVAGDTGAASEADDFILFDSNNAGVIGRHGFETENEIVKSSRYSAKWIPSTKRIVDFDVSVDFTPYKSIVFWMYGSADTPLTMRLSLFSDNPVTVGEDYYYTENITVNKDGWQLFNLDFKDFKTVGTPLGWNKISSLFIFTGGWGMPNSISDDTVVYLDSIVLTVGLPKEEKAALPEFSVNPPDSTELDKFDNGIALLAGSPVAYADRRLTLIAENDEVIPVINEGRTLVPVRFISERYDADISWEEETQEVLVKLDEKEISLKIGSAEMTVNGEPISLEASAQVIKGYTMVPFRAFAEAIGKQVFWDDRGMILITDGKIDETQDSKMIDTMLGYLRNFEITVYNQAPRLTPEALEWAFAHRLTFFDTSAFPGWGHQEIGGSLSLFYLAFAAYNDPETKSSKGVLAKDRALEHIRNIIAGGNEPMCNNGPYPANATIIFAFTMAKKTPSIWGELTGDEKSKMDLLVKSLAITTNWGFNDENDYSTGFALNGNFHKSWNPNYRCNFLPGIMSAAIYFGSADAVNEMFTSFDYNRHMKELQDAGFTNVANIWSRVDENTVENGGQIYLANGTPAGTGKGVKMPFVYNGMPLSDIEGITDNLVRYTYGAVVIDSYGTKGEKNYAYTLNEGSSPFLGQPGGMFEFASSDANGLRSDARYCYTSTLVMVPYLLILKMFNSWDGSTEKQKLNEDLIYVGTEDLIYKLTQGYRSWSKGSANEHYEYTMVPEGYLLVKDLWRKVLNFQPEPTTYIPNPSAPVVVAPVEAQEVPPLDGETEAPEGSLIPYKYSGAFVPASIYPLQKSYRDKVEIEFDLIFSPEVNYAFNGVIAYAEAGRKSAKFSDLNILLQFDQGTINIRDGGEYVRSALPVAANYRYHFRLEVNMRQKTYSVWVTPVYPEEAEAVQIAKDAAFRTGAADISDIGVLAMEFESDNEPGAFWVENHKTNGDILR